VLQHATAEQLFMLEHHNPYLIEDTGELWQFHCQREFRTKQRQDMETAREMYMASYPALILQLGLGAEKYCYGGIALFTCFRLACAHISLFS
jgi:hypothetical protein